jgi:AAA domain, putative AbiEii toxin, Type IV TA system/AAA domain
MHAMNELRIEGVRCFRDEQRIPIRPVTLLVGENSSGKSTVLAMVRAAWDVAFGATEPDFNEQPFDLGGFDAIAHHQGRRTNRTRKFMIGAEFSMRDGNAETVRSVIGTFTERIGQPVLTAWTALQGENELSVDASNPEEVRVIGKQRSSVQLDERLRTYPRETNLATVAVLAIQVRALRLKGKRSVSVPLASELYNLLPIGFSPGLRPLAGAPIRSKPERTYDPKRGLREPEGSHVPMELAALNATDPEQFRKLVQEIAEYGKAANLFTKVDVKRLGKKSGDPFQLLVAAGKGAFNLRDVGYGVSQILPILVDTLTAPKGQTFLLQQPEVHLHPRAQAALGSLIVNQAARRKQTFIVETHSDHLVDRVRMDVRTRKGKQALTARDVMILYFERRGGQATIHPIEVDDSGGLVNVPPGYRQFFLDEERRLLGL